MALRSDLGARARAARRALARTLPHGHGGALPCAAPAAPAAPHLCASSLLRCCRCSSARVRVVALERWQRAASFCAERMQGYLTKSSPFKGRDLGKALHQAFRDCEADFIALAGREGLRDGTTAVVALVEAKTLTIAHVGDSRGVLCRAGGETVAVTQDHKPELDAERRRIEGLGGFISHIGCWRAMGILAMSRAIGDLFLKPYVSAEPDVLAVPLDDADEFVVLASDGVFDVFDNEQVVQIVQSASSPQEAASLLTHSAFVAGSLDNITAVVVALRGYKPAPPSARSVVESQAALSGSLHAALLAVRAARPPWSPRAPVVVAIEPSGPPRCASSPVDALGQPPLPLALAGGVARNRRRRMARLLCRGVRERSAFVEAPFGAVGGSGRVRSLQLVHVRSCARSAMADLSARNWDHLRRSRLSENARCRQRNHGSPLYRRSHHLRARHLSAAYGRRGHAWCVPQLRP